MSTKHSIAICLALAMMSFSLLYGQGTNVQSRTFTVSGHVTVGPPALQQAVVRPMSIALRGSLSRPNSRGVIEGESRPFALQADIQTDASFKFLNVPPGNYVLEARIQAPVQQSLVRIAVSDKDITGLQIRLVPTEVLTKQQNLSEVWSLPGPWRGMTTSVREGIVYAAAPSSEAVRLPAFAMSKAPGHIRAIDYDGNIRREISVLPFREIRMAVAHFSESAAPVLIAYGAFIDNGERPATNSDLHAFDANGTLLWTYASFGIRDFAVLDSGEQNQDKVAIACNAYSVNSGLHVVDGTGKLVWKASNFKQADRVFSADVRGTGRSQIFAMSGVFGTRVFDPAGAVLSTLAAEGSVLAVQKGSPSIFMWIGGMTDSRATINALTGFGERRWSVQIPSKVTPASIHKSALASGRPWLAVSMRDGQVLVIDTERGLVIASIDGQSWIPDVAWVEGRNGAAPRLLISSKDTLRAYTVVTR